MFGAFAVGVVWANGGTPMTRAKSVEHMILHGAPAVQLTPANITMTPADGGGPGQIVRIDVSYSYTAKLPPFSLLFPHGQLLIKVGTVTKNESF